MTTTPRILEVRTRILKKNDERAREMRQAFERQGLLVVNLVSSPGTGKTTFLKQTLARLVGRGEACAAVVGDLETDNDARRLAATGVPVRQINTHGLCHLEAEMVARHLEDWDLGSLRYLFIENVGNLVCPTSWDLGESVRLALLSVTEGGDHEARPGRSLRVRRGPGPGQHRRGATGDASLRDLGQAGHGARRLARLSRRAAGDAHGRLRPRGMVSLPMQSSALQRLAQSSQPWPPWQQT